MSELFKRWLWRKTQARVQATGHAADKAAVPAAGGAAPRSSASGVPSEGGEARDNEQGELRAQPLLQSAGSTG
ncbi:hypothetical protein CUC53_07665 [Aeromonas cavernicola]|uniref:Uncharacterized protein n=1 Tax=Aeromonas cavernicola TaxID=1006623 RepID=A0A2H9U5V7_9GAMM|nr:hypothetical protein CUC53_07665 [Aeromonas cavernicola]